MTDATLAFVSHHESFTSKPRDFGQHGQVTPPRDDQNRRSTDASRLTFPLQMVVVIVGGFLSVTGAFWVSTSQIRSDVRDMATQQHDEQRLRDMERKLADERYESLKNAVSAITASQRLEEIRNQEMRIAIAAMKGPK